MLNCMQSTSVRVDSDTHSALKRIARDEHVSVGEAVRLAVRRYDQASIEAQPRLTLPTLTVASAASHAGRPTWSRSAVTTG